MKTSEEPVIVEQTFNTSAENIWKALTDIEQMKQWFFEQIESFEAKVGFKTQFIVQVEDRTYTHLWEITEVIPKKKIAYNWNYLEYSGDGFVTFEILEEASTTTLRLTNTITKDYPDGIPEFSRQSCMAGWNYFIKNRLKEFIENKY